MMNPFIMNTRQSVLIISVSLCKYDKQSYLIITKRQLLIVTGKFDYLS